MALALAERAQSPELVARAMGGLADAHYAQGPRSASEALARCIEAAWPAGWRGRDRQSGPIAECHLLDLGEWRNWRTASRWRARHRPSSRFSICCTGL